jgi:hypothetical protein
MPRQSPEVQEARKGLLECLEGILLQILPLMTGLAPDLCHVTFWLLRDF